MERNKKLRLFCQHAKNQKETAETAQQLLLASTTEAPLLSGNLASVLTGQCASG